MNFKKLSIMMILVGIMIFSVVSVYASCDSNHPCSAGFGCCLSDNQCSDFAAKKNTCVTPEKIKCIAGAADNPSAKAAGDYYCVTQITSLANNYVDCQPRDSSTAFCVVVPKFVDGLSCVENRQCISGTCTNTVCSTSTQSQAAQNQQQGPPAKKGKFKTGVEHYGGEILEGENIIVKDSSGTTGGYLGDLLAGLNTAVNNVKVNLGDASKAAKIIPGVTIAKSIKNREIALDTDLKSKNYVDNSFVHRSIYADKARVSDYSKSSLNAVFSGPACTMVGIREIGKSNVYGSYGCTGNYAGMELVMVQMGDDIWYTPPSKAEANLHAPGAAGYGLVFCCNPIPRPPVITYANLYDAGNVKKFDIHSSQMLSKCTTQITSPSAAKEVNPVEVPAIGNHEYDADNNNDHNYQYCNLDNDVCQASRWYADESNVRWVVGDKVSLICYNLAGEKSSPSVKAVLAGED